MNNNLLSPSDCELCAMIEDITKQTVTASLFKNYIRLSWLQNGIDGDNKFESQKINALKQAIRGRLGNRISEFYYDDGRQSVFFKPENIDLPEEIRTIYYKPDYKVGVRYCRQLLEVSAIQVKRENLSEILAFTGGGTMTIPRTMNGIAIYEFIDGFGTIMTAKDNDYIIRHDNGKFYVKKPNEFLREFEVKNNKEDYDSCDNCEKEVPIDLMLYDSNGVPMCPSCYEVENGNPRHIMVGTKKIFEERLSQIEEHGYDCKHDRVLNKNGQLIHVVASILTNNSEMLIRNTHWHYDWFTKFKSKPEIEQLSICGAMLAAEIDRLEDIRLNPDSTIEKDIDKSVEVTEISLPASWETIQKLAKTIFDENFGTNITSRFGKLREEYNETIEAYNEMLKSKGMFEDETLEHLKDEISDMQAVLFHIQTLLNTNPCEMLNNAVEKVIKRKTNPNFKRWTKRIMTIGDYFGKEVKTDAISQEQAKTFEQGNGENL